MKTFDERVRFTSFSPASAMSGDNSLNEVARLGHGTHFGKPGAPKSSKTFKALSPVTLASIPHKLLAPVLAASQQDLDLLKQQDIQMLLQTPFFSPCSRNQLRKMLDSAHERQVIKNATLCQENTPQSKFYLVLDGEFTVSKLVSKPPVNKDPTK